jgi:hypothetical protein
VVLSALVAMHTAKVTGTNVVHPGSGPDTVGGANKNLAGVINGTGIRPKP